MSLLVTHQCVTPPVHVPHTTLCLLHGVMQQGGHVSDLVVQWLYQHIDLPSRAKYEMKDDGTYRRCTKYMKLVRWSLPRFNALTWVKHSVSAHSYLAPRPSSNVGLNTSPPNPHTRLFCMAFPL